MHEVARELENPFRNVPNEIPLATLMAESNEALLTMFAGYHPDFFWADAAKQYASYDDAPTEPVPENPERSQPSRDRELDEKISQLMAKIEEQSREIDQLRSNMEGEKSNT